MALFSELRKELRRGLQHLNDEKVINREVLNNCWLPICIALLEVGVDLQLVIAIKHRVDNIFQRNAQSSILPRLCHQAFFNEFCKLFDSGKPPFAPQKGKTSVILFVGFKGSGTTTTCSKYAYYHQKRGWKPALVCADTYTPAAFDQLKQNATKAQFPFYLSRTESDPVKIAVDGIATFNKDNHDLIIVDTTLRHEQQESESAASLFHETRQVAEATNPDLVVFVMDSTVGRVARKQAEAFKQSVAVGSVIVTKVDAYAEGPGVITAVAATKTPVIFIGTGERMDEFEVFEVQPFLLRLLGIREFSYFIATVAQDDLIKMLPKGNFTLRNMYELFQKVLDAVPIQQVDVDLQKRNEAKLNSYMTVLGSMTNEELDSSNPKLMNESKLIRIVEGSGRSLSEVREMVEEYMLLATASSKVKGLKISKREIK